MLDGGPLFFAVGEKTTGEQLNDNKRIAEAVWVEWDDILSRYNFDTKTVVVEIDAKAEDAVRAALGAAAVHLLLFQTAHVVYVDKLLGGSFV